MGAHDDAYIEKFQPKTVAGKILVDLIDGISVRQGKLNEELRIVRLELRSGSCPTWRREELEAREITLDTAWKIYQEVRLSLIGKLGEAEKSQDQK